MNARGGFASAWPLAPALGTPSRSACPTSWGAASATRTSAGTYRVDFPGLGSTAFGDAWFGNAQIVAEGTNTVRCQLDRWSAWRPR